MTPEGNLRVLHTSDLHSRYHRLEGLLGTVEGLDLWIDTGDVETTYQRRWALDWTASDGRLAKICIERGIKVLSVGGNHDYTSLSGLLRQAGMPEGTAYDLSSAKSSVSLHGLQFAGFREIPYIAGEWNGETHLGEFKHIVDRAMDHGPDVLLTHAPPDGILDIDQHYGNGTDNILRRLSQEEQDRTPHYTVGAHRYRPRNAPDWLSRLPQIVDQMFGGCDLVLYQADPHVDDPYGGFLTTDQLHERDRIVFSVLHERGVPVAWNLAGGYQDPLRKVLDINDNTMDACVREYLTR